MPNSNSDTKTSEEFKRLWAEIQRNSSRLLACAGPHDFVPHQVVGTLTRSYRCTRCDGILRSEAHFWYALGLAHGRKNKS